MKRGRVNATYEEGYIQDHRIFPTGKVVLLAITLLAQIGMLVAAFCFEPKPQDIIHQYDVTVEALEDGSLDISYHFVWEAVDTSEELTWVEIGMANPNYTVYPESVSDTIRKYTKDSYEDEVYLVLDLNRAYVGGETLEFSFRVNQKKMLCQDEDGYFYEFVPGWFNSTPVEQYTFRWADDVGLLSAEGAQQQEDFHVWSGSFWCGEYAIMKVRFDRECFSGADVVSYREMNGNGAYDGLMENKIIGIVMSIIGVIVLIVVQVWIIDSVVSYHRGRGFLNGHGYYMHTYGRSNPYYIRARNRYHAAHASSRGGFGGGGCACACACACAGGGRAGCSQKDTYQHRTTDPLE